MCLLRKCPVCDGASAEQLLKISYARGEHDVLPADYRIMECAACGFVFADLEADESLLNRHYEQETRYANDFMTGGGGDSPAERTKWENIYEFLQPFLPSPDIAIVDVGCGCGGLLNCFRKHGFSNLLAVDASSACIETAWKHFQIPGLVGELSSVGDRSFDLIIMTGVLEHVLFPRKLLAETMRHLSPGGLCYIEVPDADHYKKFQYSPYYFFDREHINHFGCHHLMQLATQYSFYSIALCRKDLEHPGPNHLLPSLGILFRLDAKESLADNIKTYIHQSEDRERQSRYSALGDRKIFIWGVGAHCRRLLASGALSDCHIIGLVDTDPGKQGGKVGGYEVFAPARLLEYNSPDCIVAIASVVYIPQIQQQLKELGWRGEVISFT